MQCIVTLASGEPCPLPAEPESDRCVRHADPDAAPPSFYAPRLPARRRKALAAAAQLDGLSQEIAVLRTLISDATAAGNLEAARRGIEALARVMRSEQQRGASSDDLAVWLEATLDDLDAEPSTPPPVIPPRHLGTP